MVWDKLSQPNWINSPPSLFDIVTGYYPEENPKGDGPSLRPCLITQVLENKKTGSYACKIAYGTKNLKTWARKDKDIIVQNSSDLDRMGLPVATRFVIDEDMMMILPWSPPHFDCWAGKLNPKLGQLLLEYQKEYAFIMMKRMGH